MKEYIIKSFTGYYTGVFEIGGTILMINFSSEEKDALRFANMEDAEKELKRLNDSELKIIEA